MFLGTAWSEAKLLEIGHAFEQLTKHEGRLGRRAYEEAVPKTQLKDVVVLDN
jgi:amidase